MAPPLARLSPAGRAAAADAQPEAARDRRARSAGDRDQSRAEALDRLVRERHLAGDGLPGRDARPRRAPRGSAEAIADHEVAPQVGYHERNAEQIELLDQRLEKIGTMLFVATAGVVGRDAGRARDRADFVNTYGNWFTLVSAAFPALGTAVFGIRFQADFGGDALRSLATANTLRQIERGAAQGRARCRAPPTLPSRRRGSCSPTSTSGGWSTSSATCRSASRPSPHRQRQPPRVVLAQITMKTTVGGTSAANSCSGRSLNQSVSADRRARRRRW